jgi:hypothetical protein
MERAPQAAESMEIVLRPLGRIFNSGHAALALSRIRLKELSFSDKNRA